MRRHFQLLRSRILPLIIMAYVIIAASVSVQAANFGTGTFGSCQFGTCSISLTSSGAVNLDVVPTPAGSCTIQSDTVSVLTDNSNGFSLSLSSTDSNTNLVSGAHTIPATGADFTTPVAMAANTWGYRIDGASSFGTGPTTAATNTGISAAKYAGIKSSTSMETIVSTTTAANPAVDTKVWYAVCANTSVSNGTYSVQALYTAVTN
jgi:hypothetical protein